LNVVLVAVFGVLCAGQDSKSILSYEEALKDLDSAKGKTISWAATSVYNETTITAKDIKLGQCLMVLNPAPKDVRKASLFVLDGATAQLPAGVAGLGALRSMCDKGCRIVGVVSGSITRNWPVTPQPLKLPLISEAKFEALDPPAERQSDAKKK
jgi:hypothetical protein